MPTIRWGDDVLLGTDWGFLMLLTRPGRTLVRVRARSSRTTETWEGRDYSIASGPYRIHHWIFDGPSKLYVPHAVVGSVMTKKFFRWKSKRTGRRKQAGPAATTKKGREARRHGTLTHGTPALVALGLPVPRGTPPGPAPRWFPTRPPAPPTGLHCRTCRRPMLLKPFLRSPHCGPCARIAERNGFPLA